jgi:hypothetical protein
MAIEPSTRYRAGVSTPRGNWLFRGKSCETNRSSDLDRVITTHRVRLATPTVPIVILHLYPRDCELQGLCHLVFLVIENSFDRNSPRTEPASLSSWAPKTSKLAKVRLGRGAENITEVEGANITLFTYRDKTYSFSYGIAPRAAILWRLVSITLTAWVPL